MRVRGFGARGGSHPRHGRVVAAFRVADRRRHPEGRRQRGGRGRGGRLRAGGDQSVLRQHRRRRFHDRASGRRPRPLHQFPRDGAGCGVGEHVPRRERQRDSEPEPVRLSGGRRAGHGRRPRPRAAQVRQAHAQAGDGAGDPARARRLRADARRYRHPRHDDRALQDGPGGRAHLPARGRHAAATGRPPGAEGPRAHARAHRGAGPRRVLSRRDSEARRSRVEARRRRDHGGRLRVVSRAGHRAADLHVSRLRVRVGAAAEFGRRDDVRDAERARRLRPAQDGLPVGGRRPLHDRGDAPCIRGSQHAAGRPELHRQSRREADQQAVCGRDPQADQRRRGDGVGGRAARYRRAREAGDDPLFESSIATATRCLRRTPSTAASARS